MTMLRRPASKAAAAIVLGLLIALFVPVLDKVGLSSAPHQRPPVGTSVYFGRAASASDWSSGPSGYFSVYVDVRDRAMAIATGPYPASVPPLSTFAGRTSNYSFSATRCNPGCTFASANGPTPPGAFSIDPLSGDWLLQLDADCGRIDLRWSARPPTASQQVGNSNGTLSAGANALVEMSPARAHGVACGMDVDTNQARYGIDAYGGAYADRPSATP